jgi:hypothetical protein
MNYALFWSKAKGFACFMALIRDILVTLFVAQ